MVREPVGAPALRAPRPCGCLPPTMPKAVQERFATLVSLAQSRHTWPPLYSKLKAKRSEAKRSEAWGIAKRVMSAPRRCGGPRCRSKVKFQPEANRLPAQLYERGHVYTHALGWLTSQPRFHATMPLKHSACKRLAMAPGCVNKDSAKEVRANIVLGCKRTPHGRCNSPKAHK